ncbi:pentatricopeptide repeat-containing protein At5g46460, mitochondrial-like [Chenopodium quinoa]|uniref:pentatricopeptide repeat-containing protein At5g46460, mitochondrial-like n=1 Tax=Chenopodium quinoa TaxID=63459 RepID=UPI000B7745D2|nr:pentatricopeptide repeat-containing protein At5g46460, mitochondrial-like [Chenopodium quinoa]
MYISVMGQIKTWVFLGKMSFWLYKATNFSWIIPDHLICQRLHRVTRFFGTISYSDVTMCTKMITNHSKYGRLNDALHLFDQMPVRDTIAWNSIVKGCLDCGDLSMGRKLFDEMPERNVISWTTMISGYMRFGYVELAERLFKEMPFKDVAVWNSMVYGYFSNGRVGEAVKVFEEMPCRNVISWTSMISGLDQVGRSVDALSVFKRMVGDGIEPSASASIFPCLITACASSRAIELGTQIHARIVKLGCVDEEYITSSLITFYATCKQPENSSKIFRVYVHDSVVVWTSLLTGYNLNLMHNDSLTIFTDMIKLGILPNESSFTSVLNSCCALTSLDIGKVVHAEAIKLGFEASAFVGNSLVTLYSKCGGILDALKAFEGIRVKNLVSWNSIIVGSAQHGCANWVFTLFAQILRAGVEPDEITFTGLLNAASHSGVFLKGKRFFQFFTKYSLLKMNVQHYACMVDIMCRSGELDKAEDFINNMPIKPNSLVLLNLLNACRTHSDIEIAERVSKYILDLDPHCSAAYTLLSNLYASAGRWNDVSRVRSQMKRRKLAKQEGSSWLNQHDGHPDVLSGNLSHHPI